MEALRRLQVYLAKLLGRVLCWLGSHDWLVTGTSRRCRRCPKHQLQRYEYTIGADHWEDVE